MIALAACLCVSLLSGGVRPGDDEWKAGIASIKITPEVPVQMAGYASRIKPFEKVNDDLYAKALALEDSQGHRAVVVTSDIIGFTAEIAEPICKQICEKTKLKREQILLTSIHTHSAPTLSLDPNAREGFSAEDAQHTADYTKSLQSKVVDVAVRSLQEMQPARLSWGTGVATFVMNRREFTPRGVILG